MKKNFNKKLLPFCLQLFAREGAEYDIYNGAKISFKKSGDTDFTRIYGLNEVPDIGGEPNTVSTTNLDNTTYETEQQTLMPVQKYNFGFDLENPALDSNIYLASKLEDSGEVVDWKYELDTGIVITFKSKVRTTINGGKTGELKKFTMHLNPIEEPVRTITIPTGG